MLFLALFAQASTDPAEPTDQTVLYYNARVAMREGKTNEVLKLWLLRNVLEDRNHTVSAYDQDFQSIAWAALGEMGICADGHPNDDAGVGLWPISLHNWTIRNMRRRSRQRPNPFKSFAVSRQQRFISLDDILTKDELRTATFYRGRCLRPRIAMMDGGLNPLASLADRRRASRLLRYLLVRSLGTLEPGRVRGESVIKARILDIDLQLAAIAERKARRRARRRAVDGRQLGLSRAAAQEIKDTAPSHEFVEGSFGARILEECLSWPIAEWMALSQNRRLFLHDHAREYGGDPETLDGIALGIIDQLIDEANGEHVHTWISHWARGKTPEQNETIWGGDRGERLLSLDEEQGFNERSVLALQRGVQQLEGGDLDGAIRSMAYALQHAHVSSESDVVASLSLRWLSYISAQFQLTEELLAVLAEMVPRREYAVILEDMMWHAAFYADDPSFRRGERNQRGRGALNRRIELLRPMSKGDIGSFSRAIRDHMKKSPSVTLRFLKQMVQRLELENADVRATHVVTIDQIRQILQPLTPEAGNKGRSARTASELAIRFLSIREGIQGLSDEATAQERARAMGPAGEVFAGAIRLAPSDPLPWPFIASKVTAPSIFTQVKIRPLEWRRNDQRIFGWSITE